MKLKYDKLSLNTFSFKLIPKKTRNSDVKRITNRLVKGVCIKTDDGFKIQIETEVIKDSISREGQPDLLFLDFTEDSYELKGIISVFDRNPDKNGKYTRYVRTETKAKFFPGDPERYVPFCNGWVCKGYIVRIKGKLFFKFKECIAPKGFNVYIEDDDE